MKVKENPYLWIGLLCSVWVSVLLVAVVSIDGRYYARDEVTYIAVAKSFFDTGQRSGVAGHRTPGYPVFLSLIYFLFGESLLGVQVVQILMGALSIFLVYQMTFMIAGKSAAILAALFFSWNVNHIAFTTIRITEIVATMFFVLFCFWGIRSIQSISLRNRDFLWLGLFLALATLVRPFFYYLLFLVCPALLLYLRCLAYPWRKIARKLGLFILPWILIVGSVQLRNVLILGDMKYSTISSYMFIHIPTFILNGGVFHDETYRNIQNFPCSYLKNPTSCLAYYPNNHLLWLNHGKEIAWLYILENKSKLLPAFFYRQWIFFGTSVHYFDYYNSLVRFFQIPHTNPQRDETLLNVWEGKEGAWSGLIQAVYVLMQRLLWFPILGGLVYCMFTGFRNRCSAYFMLLIFLYFYLILIPVGGSYTRYRIPLFPILNSLAGIFAGMIVVNSFLWARKGWVLLRTKFQPPRHT